MKRLASDGLKSGGVRTVRRRLVQFLALAILLGLATVWAVGTVLVRSTNSVVTSPPSPARNVTIEVSPSIRLVGSYWPGGQQEDPAILLLHGNGSNRSSMYGIAERLHSRGYSVLAIDFRGHGESSAAGKSFGLNESEDAHAALDWLRNVHPQSQIGTVAFSLGGAASLVGREGPLDVDALVLVGVYPDIRSAIRNRLAIRLGDLSASAIEPLLSYQSIVRFGEWPSALSPISRLEQLEMPVLLVGGSDDRNTPPDEMRAMRDALPTQGDLLILDGITHNELGSFQSEAFAGATINFLDRNLRP